MTAMSYPNTYRRRPRSVETFNHDGLELARRRSHSRGLPVTQIALFVIFALVFKLFLVLHMGQIAYVSKMNALATGNTFERIASELMVLDPVSNWIVAEAQDLMK